MQLLLQFDIHYEPMRARFDEPINKAAHDNTFLPNAFIQKTATSALPALVPVARDKCA